MPSLHGRIAIVTGASKSIGRSIARLFAAGLLRETAASLSRRVGVRQISARWRYHSQQPAAAIALLVAPPPADA